MGKDDKCEATDKNGRRCTNVAEFLYTVHTENTLSGNFVSIDCIKMNLCKKCKEIICAPMSPLEKIDKL